MLPIINESYDRQQSLQIPDHLKCGEVYTWLCDGDLYAVECVLCEDKPLCPLSEFPQHMDIWHTDWEHNENDSITEGNHIEHGLLYDDDDEQNDDENLLLSFINEDSGLCEQDHIENVEILEPFEQVLIEQEESNALNSIEFNEDIVVENEHTDTFDDTNYSDTNEEVIIAHDDESLAMQQQVQQAKLKGEIVWEQKQRHKQEIVNNTISRSTVNRKHKQKRQYKQSKHKQFNDALKQPRETNEMEQYTREQNVKEIKTTIKDSLNISTHYNKTDLLTCKNVKRKCKQKLKSSCLQQITEVNTVTNEITRDLTFTKGNFIENVNKPIGNVDLEKVYLQNKLSQSDNGEETRAYLNFTNNQRISCNSKESNVKENKNLCKIRNASDMQENTQDYNSSMQNVRNLKGSKDKNLRNERNFQENTQAFECCSTNNKRNLRESENRKLINGRDSSELQENTQEYDSFVLNIRNLRKSKDSNLNSKGDVRDFRENTQRFRSSVQNLKNLKEDEDINLSNRRDSTNLPENNQAFESSKQNIRNLIESKDSNLCNERYSSNLQENAQQHNSSVQKMRYLRESADSNLLKGGGLSDFQENTEKCGSFTHNIRNLKESKDNNRGSGIDSSYLQENTKDHGSFIENKHKGKEAVKHKHGLQEKLPQILGDENNEGEHLMGHTETRLNESSDEEESLKQKLRELENGKDSCVERENSSGFKTLGYMKSEAKDGEENYLEHALSTSKDYEESLAEVLRNSRGTEENSREFKSMSNSQDSQHSNQCENINFSSHLRQPMNKNSLVIENSLQHSNQISSIEECFSSLGRKDSEELTLQYENLSQDVRETNYKEESSRKEGRRSKNVDVLRETKESKRNGGRNLKNIKQTGRKRRKIIRNSKEFKEISKIKTRKRKGNVRNQQKLASIHREQTNKVGNSRKCKEHPINELLGRTGTSKRKLRAKLIVNELPVEENSNAEDSRSCQKLIEKDCKAFLSNLEEIVNFRTSAAGFKRKLTRKKLESNETREANVATNCDVRKKRTSLAEENTLEPQERSITSNNSKVLTRSCSFLWNLRSKQRKLSETPYQEANSSSRQELKEISSKKVKQTLLSQFFQSKTAESIIKPLNKAQFEIDSTSSLQNIEQIDTDQKIRDSASLPSPHSTSNALAIQLSPLSPKTEEEHFEFYEPKEKLTKHHVSHLIELYKQHPRLWEQSHAEFCEPHLCRKSWEEITQLWNEYCKRNFTIAEVRIRICTLCQRYLQERERLALEGELDEFAKFPYYEQMRFLELQKSLQKRKDLYDQQNEKLVEIYEHFPVLWHVSCYKLRQAKERATAFQSISKALKLCGIHLSAMAVQKRLRSLKKCYRLEKIRYLHSQVEQTPFESNFKHFQKMQFLDKHIDPFVCRICGKIFENLTGFREHLEEEKHGSILQEESDSESDQKENEEEEDLLGENNFNLKDNEEQQKESSSEKAIIQEVLIFPPNSLQPNKILENLPMDDQIIEQMIENVANTDSFESPELDSFISSVHSCDEITVNNDLVEEIVPALQSPLENSNYIEDFPSNSLDNCSNEGPIEPKQKMLNANNIHANKEQQFTLQPLVVKVQCADFSLDLKLDPNQESLNDSENDFETPVDKCNRELPLPDSEIRKMIGFYRKYPQLWNPNHLDFNSRNLRRQAWFTLTAEFCEAVGKQFSWRTLHRKLTDYAKYYKKLTTEQEEDSKEVNIKWTFYEDFKFLDDVIAVQDELQRSVHHRDNNFKIIAIYETLPQLWNIKHQDFNKRNIKQRNIELMCNRLQEENNLQITSERLKNRLIELRAQYRAAKKQRLKCEKSQQQFFTDFEFYEALKFLDDHIDPFVCDLCQMEFKKLTDYNHHLKRQHETKKVLRSTPLSLLPHEPQQDGLLENVCHICGIKFTTRSNLLHHVKRHDGIRNYACPMCPKKFFASHSLKVHIRSHTKECPYTCEKCGMSFVSASKLNQHVKRHSNKKDYACNYCPKAFYTAFERDRHERRHLNIRDKACPICGKTFVAGSSYYAHMMLHSDTKRFKCDKCDMEFAQYAGLYKHRKRHHTGMEELK